MVAKSSVQCCSPSCKEPPRPGVCMAVASARMGFACWALEELDGQSG